MRPFSWGPGAPGGKENLFRCTTPFERILFLKTQVCNCDCDRRIEGNVLQQMVFGGGCYTKKGVAEWYDEYAGKVLKIKLVSSIFYILVVRQLGVILIKVAEIL